MNSEKPISLSQEKSFKKYGYVIVFIGVLLSILPFFLKGATVALVAASGFLVVLGTIIRNQKLGLGLLVFYAVLFSIISILMLYNT